MLVMRVRFAKTLILAQKNDTTQKTLTTNIKHENWSNQPVLRLYKKLSNKPHVVWAEESKNCLRFEIGHSYDDVPTTSQFLFDRQSSCRFLTAIFKNAWNNTTLFNAGTGTSGIRSVNRSSLRNN